MENVKIGRIFTENPLTKIVYYEGESVDHIFPGTIINFMRA